MGTFPGPIIEYYILINTIFENGAHTCNDISYEKVFEIDFTKWRDDDVPNYDNEFKSSVSIHEIEWIDPKQKETHTYNKGYEI